MINVVVSGGGDWGLIEIPINSWLKLKSIRNSRVSKSICYSVNVSVSFAAHLTRSTLTLTLKFALKFCHIHLSNVRNANAMAREGQGQGQGRGWGWGWGSGRNKQRRRFVSRVCTQIQLALLQTRILFRHFQQFSSRFRATPLLLLFFILIFPLSFSLSVRFFFSPVFCLCSSSLFCLPLTSDTIPLAVVGFTSFFPCCCCCCSCCFH